MREQNIEVVRRACIAANPEIVQFDCGSPCHCEIERARLIRLADVLYSLTKLSDLEPFDLPNFWIEIIGKYDLRKDSLTEQSDECLTFLANLLK